MFIIAIIFVDSKTASHTERVNKIDESLRIERIVSLSPSITETLFALNLGDKVVGITRFCNYPPETKEIMKVGGYVDPSYEAIASLHPDLVFLLPEHEKIKKYLSELNINYLEVDNKNSEDIKNTIRITGKICSAEKKANELLENIELTLETIKNATKNLPRPKVIISIGRTMGSGTLKDVYIAGPTTYFSELIELAGGVNSFNNKNIAYPMLSAEGIIHLNPQIIIDLVANLKTSGLTKEMILKEWESTGNIDAVKNDRVIILDSDYIVIPGPRFILLLKDLAKAFHPEIDWKF